MTALSSEGNTHPNRWLGGGPWTGLNCLPIFGFKIEKKKWTSINGRLIRTGVAEEKYPGQIHNMFQCVDVTGRILVVYREQE